MGPTLSRSAGRGAPRTLYDLPVLETPSSHDVWSSLREQAAQAGLQARTTGRILTELGIHLTILAVGLVGFFALGPLTLRIASLLLVTLGSVGVATNTHTSAHGGTSGRRWVNDLLALAGFPLVSSLSLTYWRYKHNVLHHLSPNIDGVDPDHEFTPWFALADTQFARLGRLANLYRRLHGVLFAFLATFVMVTNMRVLGAIHACRQLGGKHRRAALVDLGLLSLSIGVWWGLPLWLASPWEAIALNLSRSILLSPAMFLIFAPAHLPEEAPFFAPEAAPKEHLARQVLTTIDFRVARGVRFFLSGLERQIEHHLFPGVSHVHYQRLAPMVRAACERVGLPYREMGWGQAIAKVYRVGFRPKATVIAR